MPAPVNFLEKLIFLKFNVGPAPILDIFGDISFYAISSAFRLNVFEALSDKSLTAEDLAKVTGCDSRGLEILLEVLEPLGYIKRKGLYFKNTKMTVKWLLDSSDINYKLGFEYYYPLMIEYLPHMEKSIKEGEPYIHFYEWLGEHPEVAANYQRFMMSLAKGVIPDLLKNIKLKNDSVLDIGGSHGLYSISLCEKFKDISVTIIDSEYAMPLLREKISTSGAGGRVKLITGDFINYNFNQKYDVILLFNVLHEHLADYNLNLLKKISDTLNENGRIVILDAMREKKMSITFDLITRMFAMLFFHALGGQNYSFNEISGWLKSSGFRKVKRTNFIRTGFTMITGYK